MMLPAATGRASALQLLVDRRKAALVADVDRYLLHAAKLSSKPRARRCCCRSTGEMDRQTDGRTPDRHIDPALHTMWVALVISVL